MSSRREQALDILARLGAQPATSFYENGVAATVKTVLVELGVGFQSDGYGNIIARIPGKSPQPPFAKGGLEEHSSGQGGPGGTSSQGELEETSSQGEPGGNTSQGEPEKSPFRKGGFRGISPIAFVAHMDHPGFEAIAYEGDYLVGKALGGVPAASFQPGAPLQALLEDGRRLPASTAGRHGKDEERQALIQLAEPQPVPLPCPVVFDLVDFQLDGEFIRMRALDDLAGCGSILAALAALLEQPALGDVYGVFTRAEEVGLVGARLLAEARTLPEDTLVVSLESSRALPGADIGGGPVIRVGDAGFTFNADAESALARAREILQARPGGFRVQRQLMSGGTCEASAFALYGYRTTGIAFPLGNYHNGAPEGRIAAEFIHQDDFMGGVELIVEAARQVSERENTAFRRRLGEIPQEFRQRLRQTAG